MTKKYKSILFLLFILFSNTLYSQINKEKKPLSEILTLLQEKHIYQFTYADDIIKNIYIETPPAGLTFVDIINYLKNKTGLIFQFLDNNFIAINARESATSICGYIIDKEKGKPLEGVTVIGMENYAITDSFGFFELELTQDNESITFRHVGYQPISKISDSFERDFCLNIYLAPQIETLSEVILANYIAKGINKFANGSYNINFANFGILPGLTETDVLQTVQALPGIQSINETVSDINIRGGTHDQNLITWDGIKMYQSGHFFGLISIFNPLITTDVSIIKNGTDAYLTDGVSGTIAMNTDTKINDVISGSLGSNFINADGFLDVPLGENSSLQLSARKAINDIVELPTYSNYFDRILQDTDVEINSDIKFDFYDTSFRWLYNLTKKDQIRLNFLYVNTIFDAIEDSKKSSLNQESIAGGVFYKRNWSNKFVTTFQIYETDYDLKAKNTTFLQQQSLIQENKVSETSVKLNSWFKYNDQLSLMNGYQFTETGVTNRTEVNDPVFIDRVVEVIREHAIYSQVNYTSDSKKTNIKAGVRYNLIHFTDTLKKNEFYKHIIEPRVTLTRKISDFLSLEILGEFKHQNSSQIVNIDVASDEFFGIEKRRWRLSNNNDFPIIKSKQASVGFNYSNRGWLISAEGYYKDIKGITSVSQGFLNDYDSEKTYGSYNVKGIDFLINKRFKKLSTWLSYSFGDNQYTFKDLQENDFPNNIDISHSITFGSSYTTNDFKVSAGLNYHTGKPTTKPVFGDEIGDDNTINYQAANSSNLEDYLRIDVSATYKFNLSDKIKAFSGFSIWNAFDHNNIINNYYKIDNGQIKEIKNNALRFTPNVTFRVQF